MTVLIFLLRHGEMLAMAQSSQSAFVSRQRETVRSERRYSRLLPTRPIARLWIIGNKILSMNTLIIDRGQSHLSLKGPQLPRGALSIFHSNNVIASRWTMTVCLCIHLEAVNRGQTAGGTI